jgi:hypothetical protein
MLLTKTKKEGGHLLVAALFLKIGMLFQDGSGHLARTMIKAPPRAAEPGTELELVSHALRS